MKVVDELIGMGFNLRLDHGNIKIENRGSNPPEIGKVKLLLSELKQKKQQAIQYLQSVIIYEIPLLDNVNFDFQSNACVCSQIEGSIQWKRLDVYLKSKKIIITGIINSPEALKEFQGLEHERLVM